MPKPEDIEILKEVWAKQEETSEKLWETGETVYLETPMTLPDLSRTLYPNSNIFKAKTRLLLEVLYQARQLLEIFPGLNVSFQNRPVRVGFFGFEEREVIPEYLYHAFSKGRFLYVSSKAIIGEGVIAHELGHHTHTYFTEANHSSFLERQPWSVVEEGVQRAATLIDLMELTALDDTPDNDNFDSSTHWLLYNQCGEKGKRYRHSNPNEMVAEVFADNFEKMLSAARNLKSTDSRKQQVVINRLLSMIPRF